MWVSPSAKAAATASTGYSSIMDGARFAGTVTPFSLLALTRMSPTRSPPAMRSFSMVMSPPISISVVMRPVRCSLSSTFSTVTSEPGVISAATIGKAAEDGSPGTSMAWAFSSGRPLRRMMRAPCSSIVTEISVPKPASIFSVWSRVAMGSITTVSPGVLRPASSTADFTCAEGIGTR